MFERCLELSRWADVSGKKFALHISCITQAWTPQTSCTLSTSPTCQQVATNLSISSSCNTSLKQACWNLSFADLLQLVATTCNKSVDNLQQTCPPVEVCWKMSETCCNLCVFACVELLFSFCVSGILQKLYDYTRCPLAAPIYGGFPVKMRWSLFLFHKFSNWRLASGITRSV